jgi:hypothetical protein
MKVNNQKAAAKNAEQMINEAWAPMITRTTGVKDPEKLAWMSQLAHNTAKSLNESAPEMGANSFSEFGGAYAPYNNLYNTLGVGNVVAPKMAAMTGAQQADDKILGSGDKFPALLPLAMKVAAKTIGFELVNTTPLAGPSGVLPYMDYVYSGSKQPYGATPAFDRFSANPHVYNKKRAGAFADSSTMAFPEGAKVNGKAAWRLYGLPHAFKAVLVQADSTPVALRKYQLEEAGLVAGTRFESEHLTVEFIGWSRIDGDPMFKVIDGDQSLGETFLEAPVPFENEKVGTIELEGAKLISMLEDQLLGFAGAGDHDEDAWAGTYQDGKTLYEPMSRATGELTPARQISLQLFTKNIAVGTIQVACAVTQEQVTDLQKQWGIDVLKIVENAGVNELSQTINRHITSRLFALGWKNHARMVEVEGLEACLNMTFQKFVDADPVGPGPEDFQTVTYAIPEGEYLDQEQRYASQRMVTLPVMPMGVIEGANFENRDTLIKRIFTNILAASNWIQQRGRYGAATFVVTNIRVATLLQSDAHYSFSPIENTVKQTAGQLYPIGTVCGLTVYVDPLMKASDTRVLVGRKGGKDEPGVHFCPYVMAEVVRIIAEGTMAPKLMIKSRYALVDAGFYPETQYITFFVDCRGL